MNTWSTLAVRHSTAAARSVILLATAVMLSGCYTHALLESDPQPREEVRVQLTGAGRDNLERNQGLLLERVQGRFLGGDSETVRLEVKLGASRAIYGQASGGNITDTLTFQRTDLRLFEKREFSAARTSLVTALGIAGVASLYSIAVSSSEDGFTNGDDGGNTQFSFIVPFGPFLSAAAGLFKSP